MNKSEAYQIPKNIDEAIDKAAKHLPKGWKIMLSIEKEGYDLSLIDPNGSENDDVSGDDGLRSDIDEAIRIANGFKEE